MRLLRTISAFVVTLALAINPAVALQPLGDNVIPFTMDAAGNVSVKVGSGKVRVGGIAAGVFTPVTPAFGGDVACPANNPTQCVVNLIGGKAIAALATDPRSVNMSHQASFTGSVAEALNVWLSRIVFVDSAGAAGDGVTDDAGKFAQAAASFQGKPGTVLLTAGKVYRVSALSLPSGVKIEGTNTFPDDPANQSSLFATMGGLVLDASATGIVEHSGSGLRNMVVYRTGMTFPAPDSSRFAGTAISCSTDTRANRPANENVLILGFAQAMNFTNCDRPEARHVFGDDTNGLFQSGSGDTSIFDHVRFWPYATVGFGGFSITNISGNGSTATLNYTLPSGAAAPAVGDPITVSGSDGFAGNYTVASAPSGSQLTYANTASGSRGASGTVRDFHLIDDRAGSAFSFQGQTDDTHVTNALSFGYHHGFDFGGNGNFFGDLLWQDPATVADTTQIGFNFYNFIGRSVFGQINANGGFPSVQLNNSNAYGNVSIANLFVESPNYGDCVAASSGSNQIGNIQAVACKHSAILMGGGRLQVSNAILNQTGNNTTTPPVFWSQNVFTADMLQIGHLTTDLALGTQRDAGNNPLMPSFATGTAAITLTLSSNYDRLQLTGTGGVVAIVGGWTDREIILTSSTAASVAGNSSNIHLAGGNGWTGPGMLALRFNAAGDGLWHEEWRSSQ